MLSWEWGGLYLCLVEVDLAQVSVWDFYGADLQGPGAPHDARLDGHPRDHGQVGVNRRVGLLAEELPDQLPDPGYPCGAAHQHDLIHLLGLQAALRQHRLDGLQYLLEEVRVELLKRRAGDGHLEEDGRLAGSRGLRPRRLEVQGHPEADAGLEGEVELGLFGVLTEVVDVFLEGDCEAVRLQDLVHHVLQQPLAEVLAAQLVVP